MAFRPLIVLICVYLGLTLTGLHTTATLLGNFIEIWGLNNTEAGWLNGSQYVGYIAAVPLLAFSERIDAKRMLLAGVALNVIGYLGFALLADGLWSGVVFRLAQGVGFALSYMPGVKAVTDRVNEAERGRGTSLYVSSFSIVSSVSVILAGFLLETHGWRAAYFMPAATNVAAGLLILFLLPQKAPEQGAGPRRALFDFGHELRDPRMRGFLIGVSMHCIELLAVRGWTIVLLGMALAPVGWIGPEAVVLIVAALFVLGAPTSMIVREFGHRRGFAFAAAAAMALSALVCFGVGLSVQGPLWLLGIFILAHNLLVLADAGALNGGATQAALPGRRGAAVTLIAFANAIGSLIGPILFGAMLDLGGGRGEPWAWALAFGATSICVIVGVAALRKGMRQAPR